MRLFILFFLPFFCFANDFYYPNSYEESREEFKKNASHYLKKYPNSEFKSLSVPTKSKTDLSIDYLYIPQQNQKVEKLLILTSGVHGVEAYAGSAIEIHFLKNRMPEKLLNTMGLLIIHTVNPFGFSFNRRVTENNVDLNRNFSIHTDLFEYKNEAYEKMSAFLNPEIKIKPTFLNNCHLFLKSIINLVRLGKKQMTQAAIGGQYRKPNGIYFGGNKREPNVYLIEDLFKEKGEPYSKVLHIDLHTGYGEKGRLHFFSSQETTEKEGFNQIFDGFHIDVGSDDDFYKTSGSFDLFTLDIFKDKFVIPMTFEFGTMDSQTILGGFFSLKNMIHENQGVQYGYFDNLSKEKVTTDFINMFNPPEQSWREGILNQSEKTLSTVLYRFSIL